MVSAIVSLVIGIYEDPATGWIEGVAILSAVLIVAVVTACNDSASQDQFRKLNKQEKNIKVTMRWSGGTAEWSRGRVVEWWSGLIHKWLSDCLRAAFLPPTYWPSLLHLCLKTKVVRDATVIRKPRLKNISIASIHRPTPLPTRR